MPNPALLNLRMATAADAPDLAVTRAACFRTPWESKTFSEMLGRPENICWIIPHVAYVLVQKIPPEAEIITIAVMPTHRRQGIAEQMIGEICMELTAGGITLLHLEVNEKKIGAQKLYEKLGFKPTGRRANYYVSPDGTHADAILMQLSLPV